MLLVKTLNIEAISKECQFRENEWKLKTVIAFGQ